MYILLIKAHFYDGDNEPAYVALYPTLEEIKTDKDAILKRCSFAVVKEEDDVSDENVSDESDEDAIAELPENKKARLARMKRKALLKKEEPPWYIAVIKMNVGFTGLTELMSFFYDPRRDAEKKIYWMSRAKYVFHGVPLVFEAWCASK